MTAAGASVRVQQRQRRADPPAQQAAERGEQLGHLPRGQVRGRVEAALGGSNAILNSEWKRMMVNEEWELFFNHQCIDQ